MIPRDAVSDLVPLTHVADVDRSVAFYERLGFEMRHEYAPEDRRLWAFLERGDARLMVAEGDEAVDPGAQAVLFFLYTRDLDGLRARLVSDGVPAGAITTGNPGPDRQMEVVDPDGYALMVAEIEGERVGCCRAEGGVAPVAAWRDASVSVAARGTDAARRVVFRPGWSVSEGRVVRGGFAPYSE